MNIVKPKRICHLGDLHCFQRKRHNEFKEQTRKLCKLIEDEKIDIVYVGGDVVDSKARLTPEQIETVTFFFYSISNLVPVIVIPGNHDVDLKQKGSLDSLSPIIANVNAKHPIYYLKDSSIYNIYNIDWIVWSCLDDLDPFIDGKKSTDYSIGCYHGAVKGSLTDSNWDMSNGAIPLETFDQCDLVFLNDIHKRQSFRNDEIAYSGSWYQVKIDEEVDKGVLVWVWNEEKKKYVSEFKKLTNEYGFKTYEIKDLDTWKLEDAPDSEKFIVRLLYTGAEENFSSIKFSELKKSLKVGMPNEIILQKRFKKKAASSITKRKDGEEIDFFTEFYKREGTSAEDILQLKEIDAIYNKMVDNTDYQIGEYYVEEIEIENFLCFGENNLLNLAAMPGLIGLFALNRTGKSSLLEALAFCLFNRSPKSSGSIMKLINDQKPEGTKAWVQVKLLINGAHWRIKRTVIPAQTGKVKLEVYELVDGIEVPRHEESRPQTDAKVLRKLLGEEETFLTTVLCTADNLADFAKNRNADRLDLIIKFLGISVYDEKHKLCDEEIKKTGYLYEQLKEELEKLIPLPDLECKLDELTVELKSKHVASAKLAKEIEEHLGWNKELEQKIKELNIIGVSKSLSELQRDIGIITEELSSKQTHLKALLADQKSYIRKWKQEEPIGTWKQNPHKFDGHKETIADNKALIRNLKLQLDSETCPTCKQEWHKVDKIQIDKDVKKLEAEITKLDKEIKEHIEKEKEISFAQSQYLTIDSAIELNGSKIELLKNKQETVNQQIKIVEDNKIKIDKQFKYEEKIEFNKQIIENTRKAKQHADSNILYITKEFDMIQNNIRVYKQKVEDIKEQELFTKGLMLYKKGMHRTGIPSLILETYIPAINTEINTQINDLFELNVKFELTENNLDISFYYDEFYNEGKGKRDVTQASGMEGVVINLAIRAALTKISLLPKPSLWMLDEVWSPLDENNIEQIKPYLVRLKEQYHNIIMISHQDKVKDLPEHYIHLEKVNGITSII